MGSVYTVTTHVTVPRGGVWGRRGAGEEGYGGGGVQGRRGMGEEGCGGGGVRGRRGMGEEGCGRILVN